jgi:alanine dehydrogenase
MDSTPPASSNHAKGEIKILSLSEVEIKKCLDLRKLLDALADGFKALSDGRVVNPARPQLDIPDAGYSLAMPAWMKGMHLTVKLVNVFEGNIARGIPSHLATIHLFDPETGMPVCIMDGTYITAVRTSGSAVLSVRELARRNAKVATVVGAGVQASQHLHLLPLVRDFQEIRVFSKDFADAQALASHHSNITAVEDLEAAVRASDVVCLATHSYVPVISAEWVQPGTHVSSVGVAPPGGELPIDLIARGNLFVETRDSFSPTPVGCCELANIDPEAGTDLGAMLLGLRPGRTSDQQITIYKAMGVAMEDMVAADLAYREAKRLGAGQAISL